MLLLILNQFLKRCLPPWATGTQLCMSSLLFILSLFGWLVSIVIVILTITNLIMIKFTMKTIFIIMMHLAGCHRWHPSFYMIIWSVSIVILTIITVIIVIVIIIILLSGCHPSSYQIALKVSSTPSGTFPLMILPIVLVDNMEHDNYDDDITIFINKNSIRNLWPA